MGQVKKKADTLKPNHINNQLNVEFTQRHLQGITKNFLKYKPDENIFSFQMQNILQSCS